MQRALLETILDATAGIDRGDGPIFEIQEEHRGSLYIGGENGTTVLSDLVRITLHEAYVEAEAKNRTLHCVVYDPIFGVAVKRPREGDGPRTGF